MTMNFNPEHMQVGILTAALPGAHATRQAAGRP